MKFTTSVRQLLARAISGESFRTDSQLEVPPSLFPVIEFPGALRSASVLSVTQVQTDSFFVGMYPGPILGIAAQQDILSAIFAAGLWRVRGWMRVQFTGTVNAASEIRAELFAPGLGTVWKLGATHLIRTPLEYLISFDYVWAFAESGFQLNLHIPATVAADVLIPEVRVSANRHL